MRSAAATGTSVSVYLLHWDPPLEGGQHPRHYLGYTPRPVLERVRDHLTGRNRPARIVVAAASYGRVIKLAQVLEGGPDLEKQLKRSKRGFASTCPVCLNTDEGQVVFDGGQVLV